MFDGRYGAERNPEGYRRRDDGSHIFHNAPEYYEWWYFDAAFGNGYHAVVTFHYRNIFLSPMVPSVQLFVYRPDGGKIERYEVVAPERASAHPDYCRVRMGANRVTDTGEGYALSIRIGDAGARLDFQPTVPPWKPGTGFNYRDEKTGMTAGWVVPVPHARVEGELVIGGETLAVRGSGYHDHNWGNFHCGRTFKGWYWGRVHGGPYTVDYGWVLPRPDDAPVVAPLLVARGNEIVLSTNGLSVQLLDPRRDGKTGQRYAGRLRLACTEPWVDFSMEIRTHRVLEAVRLPRVTTHDQYYFRFIATYVMSVGIDGGKDRLEGEMLHELMLL